MQLHSSTYNVHNNFAWQVTRKCCLHYSTFIVVSNIQGSNSFQAENVIFQYSRTFHSRPVQKMKVCWLSQFLEMVLWPKSYSFPCQLKQENHSTFHSQVCHVRDREVSSSWCHSLLSHRPRKWQEPNGDEEAKHIILNCEHLARGHVH